MNFPSNNQTGAERATIICSSITAARKSRCPKCRTGEMFEIRNSHFERHIAHKSCAHCDFKFEIEPGYFYMARFINYLLNITEISLICLTTFLASGTEIIYYYLLAATFNAIVLSGLNFRLSRVLLLYCFTPGISFCPESFKGNKTLLLPAGTMDTVAR